MSVIELDFWSARVDRAAPREAIALIRERIDTITMGLLADYSRLEAELVLTRGIATELEWERRHARRLAAELRRERERAFPFTDADVLAALHRVYAGEAVSASEVCKALPSSLSQSVLVRTGMALARLAHAGDVIALPPVKEYGPRTWLPLLRGRPDSPR